MAVTAGETPSRLTAAAFVLALLLLSLQAAALYPFPYEVVDEHGHVSYVAYLAATGAWWPDFAAMTIHARDGAPTAAPNFINHPPTFYLLAEPAFRAVRALGLDPAWIRAFPLALSLGAYVAIAALGRRFGLGIVGFLGLLTGAALLKLPGLAMLFNNDQMALLGGALACLGAARRLADRGDAMGLAMLLAGVALCSVKLTAFVLVGGFAAAALAIGPHGVDRRGLAALVAVGAVAAAPFVALWLTEGSPAPNTPGQTLMLVSHAARYGWAAAERLGPLGYVMQAPEVFASQIGEGWPAVAILAAMAGAQVVAALDADDGEAVLVALVRAALAATAATLVVHVAFAYQRYAAYGWLGDLYPRYYFPLLGAYGLGWALAARRFVRLASLLWTRALSVIRPQFSENPPG